jgi:multidrug resistance efflux pump
MMMSSRGMRLIWLLGLVVLLGSALGAGWMLNQPASGTTTVSKAEAGDLSIVGPGWVDVENGITFLHPAKPGRVQAVFVNEGDEVKEGDLLISLDNSAEKMTLALADVELATAQKKLADLERQLPKDHQFDIQIRKSHVVMAQSKLDVAQKELEIQRKVLDEGTTKSKDVLVAYEKTVQGLEAAYEAEKAALAKLENFDPQAQIDLARENVNAKKILRDLAHRALVECDLYAPGDGAVLRLFATPGETLAAQPRQFAVHFCPSGPRIIRAEILQEFAGKIKEGQLALIEDDTRSGIQWKGKVARVSDWFMPRRSVLLEPFQYNDVRSLECIVSMDPGNHPFRINQRVRVTIKQGGP